MRCSTPSRPSAWSRTVPLNNTTAPQSGRTAHSYTAPIGSSSPVRRSQSSPASGGTTSSACTGRIVAVAIDGLTVRTPTRAQPGPWLRCGHVEPGPLPPHERAWRHPSELGPPPQEPTSTTGRVLIVTSATVSLLLVGLLVLTMTPGRSPSPIAVSSTVSETDVARPVISASTAAITPTALPVVTPIGDEGWAVTTREA